MVAAESSTNLDICAPRDLRLDLLVRDAETVSELSRRQEGVERSGFALSALRIGVMSIRHASGLIDAESIRHEGERLVGSVRELLTERSASLTGQLTAGLKSYFDPTDGQLPQRLDRLVRSGGDLDRLLQGFVVGDDSTLARTLTEHVGANSPLLRRLSPDQSDGILAALSAVLSKALEQQRDHVLREFSLNADDSALSRLIRNLTDANGSFRRDLADDVGKLTAEFSLDNEDGALTRLVRQVDRAQRSIVEQFSADNEDSALCRMSRLLATTNGMIQASLTLDDEKSALSRLRRELINVLAEQTKANTEFQGEVRTTLV